MSMAHLQTVLAAWDRNGTVAEGPGSGDAEFAQTEEALGFPLPAQLRVLYTHASTYSLTWGNLNILPLLPDPEVPEDLAVTTTSALMRKWKWPIPEHMLLFADNGAGEHYGLWIDPVDPAREPLVIETGEVFEPACLAVAAVDLGAFLISRTATLWMSPVEEGGDPDALRTELGLPPTLLDLIEPYLSGGDPEDPRFDDIVAAFYRAVDSWASPGMPLPIPNVYENGLTAEQIQALSQTIAR